MAALPTARVQARPASRAQIIMALVAVYSVWGSTYLAIRFADQTLPPFLMASVRFLIAGVLLYSWSRLRGVPQPRRREWRAASIVGVLLLAGGNGAVVFVEQRVASSAAALLVALVPLWMVLLDWARPHGRRPGALVLAGVAVGFGGVAVLVTHAGSASGGSLNPLAYVLIGSSAVWAFGSLYAQRAPLPPSGLMSTSVEMLAGGAALLLVAVLTGEPSQLAGHAISSQSLIAVAYLIVFGSLVAYTAYTWLLRNVTSALASTYAYVNPMVAVVLGAAFAGEPLTGWTLLSAGCIVTAIVLITLRPAHRVPVAAERGEEASTSTERDDLESVPEPVDVGSGE